MSKTKDLLIEIGTEELPPKNLQRLSKAFVEKITSGLSQAKLSHGEVQRFATPRRLALLVHKLACQQPEHTIEKLGPSISAAYDDNNKPTAAALGFARSCKVALEELQTTKTPKGERLSFVEKQSGTPSEQLIPSIVETALKQLPARRFMRWGQNDSSFVRPIHWIVLLFGTKVIPAKIMGIETSNKTHGHRFHHPQAITLRNPNEYAEKLMKANVIADYQQRKQTIRKQISDIAQAKGQIVIDEDLLDEVTGLNEWPVALLGGFEQRFLQVPAEAIISAMKVHQRCFPILDKHNKLLPYFITVSNIDSTDPERVVQGNQRVIRARLADAEFFYQTDLKRSLSIYSDELKTVVFQKQLGTLFDKTTRISKLAVKIAKLIHADEKVTKQAAQLAKADLMTDMVGEFPELQGTMGYYYALQEKLPKSVAKAIGEQYQPRYAGDNLPTSLEACAVALADKIDTLVGIFAINQLPTGNKDPFALRRTALGILRIIIERQLRLDLRELLDFAKKLYQVDLPNTQVTDQALGFILERLRAWYLEQGISADVFSTVAARAPSAPLDFHQRINAVQHFQKLPQAKALAAANKRVSNILKKQNGTLKTSVINGKLLTLDAERELAKQLHAKEQAVEKYSKQAEYTKALTTLAELQKPVDQFFDDVLVMTDDKALRDNRLALLSLLRSLFLQVADISLLKI